MNFNYSTITNLYNKFVKKIRGGQGENINNQDPYQTQPITDGSVVNEQDTQLSESQQPESQQPESQPPESQPSDSQPSDSQPSESQVSESQPPESQVSETTIDDSQNEPSQNTTIDDSQIQPPSNIDESQNEPSQNTTIDDSQVVSYQPNSEIPDETDESQSNLNPDDVLNSQASTQDQNNVLTPASQFDATSASEDSSNINEPTSVTTEEDPQETYEQPLTQETTEEQPASVTTEEQLHMQENAEEQLPVQETTQEEPSQPTEIPPVIPAFIPNNQNEPYYDSVPYKANQKTYNYLNRDNLKTTFSGLTERNTNPYTIYLCSYTMILNQYLPYFQYWLINIDNTSYKFPSFEFTLPLHPVNPENADALNENENQTPDDELFSNAYQTELNKYYGENIPTFKGFIENENIIYVILEEKDNTLLDTYKSAFKPAILHETLNLRKICNVVIDESVSNLFKYEYIATIYDETDKVVEYPYLLYLCQGSQGAYINVESVENTEVFIPNKILHDSLGYCYMFTSKMLNEGASNTKRFVVFIENALYILNKSIASSEYHLFDNAEIEEDKDDPDCRNYQYSSVYFWEGNIQLWALYSSKYIIAI